MSAAHQTFGHIKSPRKSKHYDLRQHHLILQPPHQIEVVYIPLQLFVHAYYIYRFPFQIRAWTRAYDSIRDVTRSLSGQPLGFQLKVRCMKCWGFYPKYGGWRIS